MGSSRVSMEPCIVQSTCKEFGQAPDGENTELASDLEFHPWVCIQERQKHSHENVYIKLTTTPCMIFKNQNQGRCLSAHEWISKL